MNTALNPTMRSSACALVRAYELGKEREKKIGSFGLRMLISTPETITFLAERGDVSFSTAKQPSSEACSRPYRRYATPR